jgi:hypothetical protein
MISGYSNFYAVSVALLRYIGLGLRSTASNDLNEEIICSEQASNQVHFVRAMGILFNVSLVNDIRYVPIHGMVVLLIYSYIVLWPFLLLCFCGIL